MTSEKIYTLIIFEPTCGYPDGVGKLPTSMYRDVSGVLKESREVITETWKSWKITDEDIDECISILEKKKEYEVLFGYILQIKEFDLD